MTRAIHVRDGALALDALPPLARPDGWLRIAVHAAGVNRADLVQRAGHYPPPPGASALLGLEVAGVVTEADDPSWLGQRVCALLAGGGYAEEVVVPADHVLPLPDRVGWDEGAAFVEVFATAWLNLLDEGGLRGTSGRFVLLHAGASGVGTAAIQICRLLGHRCFVTVGSAEKVARCVALGADGGAVRHDGPWLPAVRAWREGVDVILDPVGAAYLDDDLHALAVDGRLVLIGLMSGRTAPLDLGRVLSKRLRIVGSTLRNRSDAFKAALIADLRAHLWPAWADGRVTAVVDRVFPWAEAEAAHAHMASNASFGAIVLRVR